MQHLAVLLTIRDPSGALPTDRIQLEAAIRRLLREGDRNIDVSIITVSAEKTRKGAPA
jgi:hypothetical protein